MTVRKITNGDFALNALGQFVVFSTRMPIKHGTATRVIGTYPSDAAFLIGSPCVRVVRRVRYVITGRDGYRRHGGALGLTDTLYTKPCEPLDNGIRSRNVVPAVPSPSSPG